MADVTLGSSGAAADDFWAGDTTDQRRIRAWLSKPAVRTWRSLSLTLVLSLALAFAVEFIARGSLAATLAFFGDLHRPALATVGLFALVALAIDALLGRTHGGLLVIAPLVLIPAWISSEKGMYLSDPFYPTDFLYARQIVELLPLLVSDRPKTAIALAVAVVAGLLLVVAAFRGWRRRAPRLTRRARLARLVLTVPALAAFVSIMDYATFSWARDRLQIIPMMWDQKENYAFNGFTLAFALNLPMADVSRPLGYSAEAVDNIAGFPAASVPRRQARHHRRDERVPLGPDQAARGEDHTRSDPDRAGSELRHDVFTGVRRHDRQYRIRGADRLLERLPALWQHSLSAIYPPAAALARHLPAERRIHDARAASVQRMVLEPQPRLPGVRLRAASCPRTSCRHCKNAGGCPPTSPSPTRSSARPTRLDKPFFFFAVTLQGHGPYEPDRYPDATHKVDARVSAWSKASIVSYAEGVSDADRGLKRLMDWASKRKRKTVIAFFGDHLPPLGPVYVETGFMKEPVASRKAPVLRDDRSSTRRRLSSGRTAAARSTIWAA